MILNLFGSFPQAVQLGVQMSSMFLSMQHQHSIQCDDTSIEPPYFQVIEILPLHILML